MIIDTHSHIYLPEFGEDRDAMLIRAGSEGIRLILMPAIDNETHLTMLEIEALYRGKCLSMMGLHPCSVKEGYKQELRMIEEYFERRRFVAVGETGLCQTSSVTAEYRARGVGPVDSRHVLCL